ncbi:MAG: hypothetical protein CVU39_24000 [Chloroflexi bacterium HGW-Chloroflexi-10]|nr:MAG: hypothetical protein CVU39_24000 [Chloroflexi bacterium HGW-Chloroflexi-10]
MLDWKQMDWSQVYWIGGSPCSGKSSVAEILCAQLGWYSYRADDFFGRHVQRSTAQFQPLTWRLSSLSPEEIWMAPVAEQVERELGIYREIFGFILEDIAGLPKPVLVEGAACMPELVKAFIEQGSRAVWMIPTEAFQRRHYAMRPWAQGIVQDCSDPRRAYDNWMARDALFASEISRQTSVMGLPLKVVDGDQGIEENASWVKAELLQD